VYSEVMYALLDLCYRLSSKEPEKELGDLEYTR
jgi:hypothetical protein